MYCRILDTYPKYRVFNKLTKESVEYHQSHLFQFKHHAVIGINGLKRFLGYNITPLQADVNYHHKGCWSDLHSNHSERLFAL